MMLVTGCAGFIGSRLARRLLDEGHKVVGIDRFSDSYPKPLKEKNMEDFIGSDNFRFVEKDILDADIPKLLKGVDYVFHQAAQAGLRESWGKGFETYARDNIIATQHLLEACRSAGIKNFIFASSSSVYGNTKKLPTSEDDEKRPLSPYGATKLSCEHLCDIYKGNFGVPVTVLRYFTVYGPGQRPDMAFHRFISTAMKGGTIEVFGSGDQTRDFTYVDDIVNANVLAMKPGSVGETFNIGGGSRSSVNSAIGIIREFIKEGFGVKHAKAEAGEVSHTSADISKARKVLGYRPEVPLREGIQRQIAWMKKSVL